MPLAKNIRKYNGVLIAFSSLSYKNKIKQQQQPKNLISQADTTKKPRAADARLFFKKFIAACCASTFSSNRNHS